MATAPVGQCIKAALLVGAQLGGGAPLVPGVTRSWSSRLPAESIGSPLWSQLTKVERAKRKPKWWNDY